MEAGRLELAGIGKRFLRSQPNGCTDPLFKEPRGAAPFS